MANDVSAAIRYFRDSVKTALVGRTFRLSLQLSTLQKTLSSLNDTLAGVGSRFADTIEGFLARMQDNFLLESCLKYAEFEKRLPEPNEVSPFATQIPLHDDAAAFFCKIMNIDAKLGRAFLSALSIMNGNAEPSKTDDELVEDLLRSRNVRVFQEIAALTEASANFHLLQDVELCTDECRLVNETPERLFDERVDALVKYISLIYPAENNGRLYRDRLHAELKEKRGEFTTAEYNAITGLPVSVVSTITQGEATLTPLTHDTIPSTPQELSIPKSYRVSRPPRYAGPTGEKAFRRLYDIMKDIYFKCSSLENFTGLFLCPANEQIEAYTKIDWIHEDGIRGLQYFFEALYRGDEYAVATSIPKDKLSKIFLVNGVRKKLSDNSLYCWGDDKRIDNRHKQEKKIRKYLELIDESFKEPKDRQ